MNNENYVVETKEMPKKWIADRTSNNIAILLYLVLAIAIWGVGMLILGDIGLFIPFIYIFILPFILIFSLRKQVVNYGSFIYDEGLYLVMFKNSNIAGANVLNSIGASGVGAAYAIQGIRDNNAYLNKVIGIKDILKLAEKPVIWKFISVKNISHVNKNTYKIEAQYRDLNKCKIKNIEFKLKNRYNNFEDLVKIFESMKNEI